jgi:tagatose-1,6-bisphosphate aldolase
MKKISQETFDEILRENIEEFEETKEQALEDTIKQFVKQGVDLSNIDITGGENKQEIIDNIVKISNLSSSNEEIINALSCLSNLCCERTNIINKSNANRFQDNGGISTVFQLLERKPTDEIIIHSLNLLTDLTRNHGNSFNSLYSDFPPKQTINFKFFFSIIFVCEI